jgi:hypothetical protein
MTEQQRGPRGAKSFRDATQQVRESEPTPDDLQELDESGPPEDDPEADVDAREVPQVTGPAQPRDLTGLPGWVKIPQDLEFPPRGVTWCCMRFEPEWTDRPDAGERQCILWNLSVGDEKFARKRARGDAESMLDEQAKQMIRAIDGQRIDYGSPNSPYSPDRFWDEIGKKCRMLVMNYFMKVHTLEPAEKLHFFANCLVARTVAPSATGRTAKARGPRTRTT